MNIFNESSLFLRLTLAMKIYMTVLTQIHMFSSLQTIIQRYNISKLSSAAITFTPAHTSFKNSQRIFLFSNWITGLILG